MRRPAEPSAADGLHDEPAHPARPTDRMKLTELIVQVRLNGARLRQADPARWIVVEHLLDAIEEHLQ